MPQRIHLLICVVATGLILASTSAAQAQTIWYVDSNNCPGPGSGTSEDPFCTIQAGIDAAIDGDKVVVKDGIYTGASNRPVIDGKGIIVRSANGPENCVIDCQLQGRGFSVLSGGSSVTQILGFTIINGSASYGGGIYSAADEMVITNCIIRNCEATNDPPDIVEGGGGIHSRGLGEVWVISCLIIDNTAVTRGGGIYGENGWLLRIINCTIFGNSASEGGGVFFTACNARPYNSILWNNSAPIGPEGSIVETGSLQIFSCDVQGGQASFANNLDDPGWTDFYWGPGMIDTDPSFVDPNNNDYHLQANSPCIDTGRIDGYITQVLHSTTDLDGEPRIFVHQVDIGADEYLDCNRNDVVDYQEMAEGADDCNENEILDECEGDCNQNDIADECDIADGTSLDDDNNGILDECGDILHVPAGYPTIQSAVSAADNGYTVLVADGLYTGPGNHSISLPDRGLIVRSENGPKNCVIDCQQLGRAFTLRYSENFGSQIQGFTIINGYHAYGGGIYAGTGGAVITDCIIRNCEAWYIGRGTGGGGINGGGTITNCMISGNTTAYFGGGIYCGEGNSPTITNCTITGNTAGKGGGIASAGGSMTIHNSILRGNTATVGPEGYTWWSGYTTVSYSDVEGGQDSFAFSLVGNGGLIWGNGNIDADPLFVDPGNDDFHLQVSSPCIDAGDPDFVPQPGETDFDGEPRVMGCRVDMGADEFFPDCNNNGILDDNDILSGSSQDCNDNCKPDECDISNGGGSLDCNDNGIPDECDIASCPNEDLSCQDCNRNGIPDKCDILSCPDEDPSCQDCNENRIPDSCDIANSGTSEDCNENGIPDECEQAPCAICDLNYDGKVDREDLKIMKRCLSQETHVIPNDCVVADLDGDGKVTWRDWKLFMKCYRQYIVPSQIGSHNDLAPMRK